MQWKFKLKKTSVINDNKTFRELEKGIITCQSALKRFKKDNDIEDDISEEEFKTWLRGLGWNV